MIKTDRLQIILAHNDEPVPDEFLNYGKPNLPEESLSPKQIQKWKSRRLAHFLLHLLFEQNGLDLALLQNIQKTQSGRPFVSHPNVDFNISHSGNWVAVIFSYSEQKKAVGIDIEHPQKERRYLDLLNHFTDPNEIAEINDFTIQPHLSTLKQRFYLSWCLREAILKSQGVGIVKLSEVRHHLSQKQILSAHCPTGYLAFYHQLPCFLAYFSEQEQLAKFSKWKNGRLHTISSNEPLIYQVNSV